MNKEERDAYLEVSDLLDLLEEEGEITEEVNAAGQRTLVSLIIHGMMPPRISAHGKDSVVMHWDEFRAFDRVTQTSWTIEPRRVSMLVSTQEKIHYRDTVEVEDLFSHALDLLVKRFVNTLRLTEFSEQILYKRNKSTLGWRS